MRASSWLSLGFEDLVREIAPDDATNPGSFASPFDVLIVGSGYGGAVAAAQFAGAKDGSGNAITVAVLERGQEYLPGSFPGSADELAGHARFSTAGATQPRGRLDGLFDVRLGPDVNAIVANGLGGGSLINAGVMLEPTGAALQNLPPDIGPYFAKARAALGANELQPGDAPLKAMALRAIDPMQHQLVPITVGVPDLATGKVAPTSGNVTLEKCIGCGDCATGCNFGAKNSLDLNLLVTAAQRGALIYTGATVLWIESGAGGHGWIVHAVPTDRQLRTRHGEPLRIHARRLVLAAGTLGSTEILLRSKSDTLKFSPALGHGFSANGDMIAVVYDHAAEANAVADEEQPPIERHIGPTITSMIDRRGDPKAAYVIQELAVPGPLRTLFEEIFTTARVLHGLAETDASIHDDNDQGIDPCAVDRKKLRHSSVVAMMGDDAAEGSIELAGGREEASGDGAVTIRWPLLRSGKAGTVNDSLFDRQMDALGALMCANHPGGIALPNPVWRLLPRSLSFLMDEIYGPVLTVHPLGGCARVVDDMGRVYNASAPKAGTPFEDLVVLDGSIVPCALGVNPALTITALAMRAAEMLCRKWQLTPSDEAPTPRVRPAFQPKEYPRKAPARFAVVERLSGKATIDVDGTPKEKVVELTLHFRPKEMRPLVSELQRTLEVDPDKSRLRVFSCEAHANALVPSVKEPDVEKRLEAAADFPGVPLDGTLRFFHREASTVCDRRKRALVGWFLNRGLRDTVQFFWKAWREKGQKKGSEDGVMNRARSAWILSSHAGEVRRFDYALTAYFPGGPKVEIAGNKRMTYALRTNMWEQLESMALTRFGTGSCEGVLGVDLKYFATAKTPLARIHSLHNLPCALIDLGAFAGHLARVLVNVHMWTFRRPDAPRIREPQRLPAKIQRGWLREFLRLAPPAPQVYEIPLGALPNGSPVRVRLTRYACFDSRACPVLLIHGYSASGTTFAHTDLKPSITEVLWRQGRDVWIADLRTSSGMPTATEPWSFEDAGLVDIPAAIERVLRETGSKQVDIVAHCMGAAMLSMAILKRPEPGDPYFDVREALPHLVRRVVLSQVGPLVEFTPINVLRAYILRYVRHYFGISSFEFRVKDAPSLKEQLVDRFLSSLRYPPEELRIENPLVSWPCRPNEYVGTRHRIDALYGRTFSLANLDDDVLDDIDDFFGPLNLETVSQAMHFAQQKLITDRNGRNIFLNRESRDKRWIMHTLAIHGADNGLADVRTQARIDNYFNYDDATGAALPTPRIERLLIPGAGHQDSFIGRSSTTQPIFSAIASFLAEPKAAPKILNAAHWLVRPPWIGPHRGVAMRGPVTVAAATDRALGDSALAVCVAVQLDPNTGHYQPVPVQLQAGLPPDSMYVFSTNCDKDGWFSVALPGVPLPLGTDGLLMLLFYDQSPAAVPGEIAQIRELLTSLNENDFRVPLNFAVAATPAAAPAAGPAAAPAAPGLIHRGVAVQIQTWLIGLAKLFDQIRLDTWMRDLVVEELRTRTAGELKSGLIRDAGQLTFGRQVNRLFVASCQYPGGLIDEGPAATSYRALAARLGALGHADGANRLLLLLGDQIYSDATAGLFDPAIKDDRYRRTHEALFSRDEVKEVMRNTAAVMMLDDHEIVDNWEPCADDPRPMQSAQAGIDAYKDFQRRAGPPLPDSTAQGRDVLWFKHKVGDAPIFVADTRTERTVRRAADPDAARIMGDAQFGELCKWLDERQADPVTRAAPKFIASPAILLPRRLGMDRAVHVGPYRAAQSPSMVPDAWDGYPESRAALLRYIADHGIANVIFVSGDEHHFLLAKADVTGPAGTQVVYSIHSSPLYAPFPFANSHPADFALDESFPLDRGGVHHCTVATQPILMQCGFTELEVTFEPATGWRVSVTFHDALAGPQPPIDLPLTVPA